MSKSDITDCIESLEDIYNKVDAMYPKDERKMYEEMIEYLLSKGLTKTYLPERLEIVSEMPRTPSGKIQKFHLRETLQR